VSHKKVVIDIGTPVPLHAGGDGHQSMDVYQVEEHRAGITLPDAVIDCNFIRCSPIEDQCGVPVNQHHLEELHERHGVTQLPHISREGSSLPV